MPTKNVSLSKQQEKFIHESIRRGAYRNASEVVRAGLRLLERDEKRDAMKLARLRKLTREAVAEVERGEYEIVEVDELDAFLNRLSPKRRAHR